MTYIVQPEDKGGVFTCLAENAAGNDSADTVVVITSELAYYEENISKFAKIPGNDKDIYDEYAVKTTAQNHNILNIYALPLNN